MTVTHSTTAAGRNAAQKYKAAGRLFMPSVYFEWLQENTLCGPSIIDAFVKDVPGNTQDVSPLRDGQCLPVIRESNITPLVVHLFCASSPSAIIGRIRTIVVYAVQGAPFRTLPHIPKEVSKRFAPTVADGNTAPAIVGIGFVLWTVAASKHRNICPVQRMVRESVLPCSGNTVLETKTTATLGGSASQAITGNLAVIAAIAKTVPDGETELVYMGERKGDQAPKSLTGQVLNAGRYFCGIMGLHREPPLFSVTCPETLQRCRDIFLIAIGIIPQVARADNSQRWYSYV